MTWNKNMDDAPRDGTHSLTVKTKYSNDGLIEQETFQTGIMGAIMRQVMDTREQHIRQALIALGWTPPQPPEVEG